MSDPLSHLTPQRRAVVEAICAADQPLRAPEIAELVPSSEESVRQMLTPLVEAGLISRVTRGLYWRPENVDREVRELDYQPGNGSHQRMGPPMQAPRSTADFVGHPDALTPYDHLARAGRAVVAEARDARGQIIYAVRVEFLVRLEPEQISMGYDVEAATAETA